MSLSVITPPAAEPVSLAEVKAYLRIDGTDEDTLLTRLIAAARSYLERAMDRAFLTQTLRLTLDRWPMNRAVPAHAVELPRPPLQSVSQVTLTDNEGTQTVWAAANYVVDAGGEPGRIAPKAGAPFPLAGREVAGIAIDYVAGYGAGADDVPQPLRQAMLRLIAQWHEHRDGGAKGEEMSVLPADIEALVAPYRVARL